MSDVHGIPAAWYPDPADAGRLRYWDGSTWTQQLRDAPALSESSTVGSPLTEFTGYDRIGQSASYVPFTRGGAPEDLPGARVPTAGTSTVAIWLYALMPTMLLLHQYFAWDFTPSDIINLIVHGALLLGTVVVAVVLSAIDSSQLQNRGYLRAPPAILGVLPPVYVIARVIAIGPRALGAALFALIVQGAVVAMLVVLTQPAGAVTGTPTAEPVDSAGMAAPFTESQLAYLLTPEGMAEKIVYDAAASSVHYDEVDCQPLDSTNLGAQTTCHATGALASYELLVQVLPNGTSTPFAVVSITPLLE